MKLEFSIEGEKQLSRKLIGLEGDMRNFTSEFRRTGDYLKRFFQGEVFESRGSAIQEPWKALSPRYAAWKAKKYPGKGILERTGKMRRSFKFEVAPSAVMITNTAPYFKYHQSRLPRTRLPRRVMMKLDEKRKQAIVKIFHEAAIKRARRRGL